LCGALNLFAPIPKMISAHKSKGKDECKLLIGLKTHEAGCLFARIVIRTYLYDCSLRPRLWDQGCSLVTHMKRYVGKAI